MGSIISKFLIYFHDWKLSYTDPTVLSLKEYLNICSLDNIKKLNPSTLKICCGNQSSDMDSVMSAITYSYYNYLFDNKVVLPVINIPREDLRLRKDIVNLLEQVGVDSEVQSQKCPLIFIEDIASLKKTFKSTIDAVLVDHNEPQGLAIGTIDRVVGIIDHHEDTKSYDKRLIQSFNNPLIIQVCGSCTSLVTNYWIPKLTTTRIDSFVLKLGLAAALLDTSNFKSKVEPQDMQALVSYEKGISASFELNSYFKQLKKDKSDLSGFSMLDLLKKDYKMFEFNGYKIGMSSLGKSMENFVSKFGTENIKDDCKSFYGKSMDILLLLTSYSDSDKTHKRQIVFYSGENIELQEKVVEAIKEELGLQKLSDLEQFAGYQQENSNASRKQIAPIVGKALKNI